MFPNLEKMQLSGVTPTYIEPLPAPLPRNTKAVIVEVFCYFDNSAVNSHNYLYADIQQDGSGPEGQVKTVNKRVNIYANDFVDEMMIPWDSSLPNSLKVAVTNSYITGGNLNWYRIRIVGYITA